MFLEKIYAARKILIEEEKLKENIEQLQVQIEAINRKPYSFKEALQRKKEISLVAEIKRASPSKGVFDEGLDAVAQAKHYERCEADAISVLTEPQYFKGHYEDLLEVRQHVKLPLLNKDFIFDPWQVYKAKAIGADVILLIATMLDEETLVSLYNLAISIGLEVLVEVHNEEDLQKALPLTEAVIGINNRDLSSFVTSLDVTKKLVQQIPEERIVITESGIHTKEDVASLVDYNISAMLVGESLVKTRDLEAQIKDLKSGGYREN